MVAGLHINKNTVKYIETAVTSLVAVVGRNKIVHLKINNCPIPCIVPYNKLMPFIKSIPVGTLYSVSETLCYDLPESE